MIDIALFSDYLEYFLDGNISPEEIQEKIDEFIESGWIRDYVFSTLSEISSKIKSDSFVIDPSKNGRFLNLHSKGDGGKLRSTLNLQNGFYQLALHVAGPVKSIHIPLGEMTVEHFRIAGGGAGNVYGLPNPALRLERIGSCVVPPRTPLIRSDMLDVFEIRPDPSLQTLVYLDHSGDLGYQLAFDRETLAFLGTSMTDVSAAKAITLVELLEAFGSAGLGDAAHRLTHHDNSIVRWRALSALNKARHPEVAATLARFCDDDVAFVQQGAKRVLQQGRTD